MLAILVQSQDLKKFQVPVDRNCSRQVDRKNRKIFLPYREKSLFCVIVRVSRTVIWEKDV